MYTDGELEEILAEDDVYRLLTEPLPHPGGSGGAARPGYRPRRRPPPENLERIGFMLQRALRAYRLVLWVEYEEMGILPSQEALLSELWWIESNESQHALARRLGTSRQSITRSLGRLERAGLIEREPAPGDHRQALVRLTRLGEIIIQHAGQALRETERAALEGMSGKWAGALERALLQIEENCVARIRELRAPPPPLDAPTRWS